jgi:hypothetical protein
MSNMEIVWLENPITGSFINPAFIVNVGTVQDPVSNNYRYTLTISGGIGYQSGTLFDTPADAIDAIAAIFNQVLANTSTTVTSVALT